MPQDDRGPLLVTGAAGFIGSNFVHAVLEQGGRKVVALDKLTYAGSLENLRDRQDDPNLQFVQGDIGDRGLVDELLARHRPDAIVNFAAESHVDRSIDGPRVFMETNVVGTFELLEASRAHLEAVPEARERFRFLHVSTDEVYGSLGPDGQFSETTPYAPNSPYSASKAAADHWVRAYHETFSLPALITNCSNNYGPYQFPEKLIPLVALNALEGRDLPIYGDGGNIRDWLFVRDHCEGILAVLERGRLGEKYNIGGNEERTNLQVVDEICAALDEVVPAASNPRLQERGLSAYTDLKKFVPDRPGHDRRYAIDAGKIRDELGWTPRYDFPTALRETVRWFVENEGWREAIQRERYDRERLGLGAAERG